MLNIYNPKNTSWFIFLTILTANFIVYSSTLTNGFLAGWDDNLYVYQNLDIQEVSFQNIKNIFSRNYVGNYAPVHMLSYMFDHVIWGLKPVGYILHNILLNSLNGFLLYSVLKGFKGGSFVALCSALVFSLHPVQVESVAWISQRKNLLSMFFMLISLLLYIRHKPTNELKTKNYLFSVAIFLLAALTKSVVVVFPLVLIFYDVLFLKVKSLKKIFLDKIPYLAISCVGVLLTITSHSADHNGGMINTSHGGSSYPTFLTMLTVFKDYIVNIIFPFNLSAYYEPGIKYGFDLEIVLSVAVFVGVILSPLLFPKPHRTTALFWVVVFLVFLLPVSQLVPIISLMNDRFLYFPMLGVSGLIIVSCQSWPVLNKRFLQSFFVLLVIFLAFLSYDRGKVWRDDLSLWDAASHSQPHSSFVWFFLGVAHENLGDLAKAAKSYGKAVELNPYRLDAAFNLGVIHAQTLDFQTAQQIFLYVYEKKPYDIKNMMMLAQVYYLQTDYANSRRFYLAALAIDPGNISALNYLSLVELRNGNLEQSQAYWGRALSLGGQTRELLIDRARLESMVQNEVWPLDTRPTK